MCTGLGMPKNTLGTMCPSFKATGRRNIHPWQGNALRLAMSTNGTEAWPANAFTRSNRISACSCKAVKSECSSNVIWKKWKVIPSNDYDEHGITLGIIDTRKSAKAAGNNLWVEGRYGKLKPFKGVISIPFAGWNVRKNSTSEGLARFYKRTFNKWFGKHAHKQHGR